MVARPERIEPGPGQESVWDYPRPPRLEAVDETLRVLFAGETVATTDKGFRVLETSHPPVYYIPPADVRSAFLVAAPGQSFCEFKGAARYWSLAVDGRRSENAAWSYPVPTRDFMALKVYLAFYASRVDECWVGDQQVQPQDGDFYGGWITARVVGPFKGAPGTMGWQVQKPEPPHPNPSSPWGEGLFVPFSPRGEGGPKGRMRRLPAPSDRTPPPRPPGPR